MYWNCENVCGEAIILRLTLTWDVLKLVWIREENSIHRININMRCIEMLETKTFQHGYLD